MSKQPEFPFKFKQCLQVFKCNPKAKLPTRNLPEDAGVDLYSVEDLFLSVGLTHKISTGVSIHIPPGYVGLIQDRSSLASKGLRTGAGVIDSGYSGEISIVMHNLSNTDDIVNTKNNRFDMGYQVKKYDKIAQLLLVKIETPAIEEVDKLWVSDRGQGGFGSSGR